ncbi:uncharacterized protein LOC143030944 isoform X2 [Oratosquilla oratoria]|uniref:uncharacterized protein LOC143030944 isoform X2 n=1 Tax=Oratosquilla oratoria TaxID=337810 RepID=UPI003F76F6D6
MSLRNGMPQGVPERVTTAIAEGEGRNLRLFWNLGHNTTDDEGGEASKRREGREQGRVGKDREKGGVELIVCGRTYKNGIRKREGKRIKNTVLNNSKSVHVYLLLGHFLIFFQICATATAVDVVDSISIPYDVDGNGLSPEVEKFSEDKFPPASTASYTVTKYDLEENDIEASSLEVTPTNRPPNSDVIATTKPTLPTVNNSVAARSKFKSSCTSTNIWPKDVGEKYLDIGYLHTQRGRHIERLGLKIPGAFTYAVDMINTGSKLPEGYKLRMNIFDTEGDQVKSTQSVVDLICCRSCQTVAFFGIERTCYVEGTVAAAKNLAMISHMCNDPRVEDKREFPTFARTNPSSKKVPTTLFYSWRLRKSKWVAPQASTDTLSLMVTMTLMMRT